MKHFPGLLVGLLLAQCVAACGSAPPPAPAGVTVPRKLTLEAPSRVPRGFPEQTYAPPDVFERRLENGMRVLVMEQRDLPIVYFALVVRRGTTDAPPGVASYVGAVLPSGMQGLDVGFHVWTQYDAMGIDAVGITFPGYGSNLPEATFAGLAGLLKGSAISAEALDLERERRLVLASRQSNDDETQLARLERASLYPREHPYRELTFGDERVAQSIGAAELGRFFQEQVQPDQLVAVAVGDVARQSFVDSIRQAFGPWRGRAISRLPLPEPIVAPLGGVPLTLVDRPSTPMARILVAARGASWQSPDYEPLFILSTILGGSVMSRLNLNLRETKLYAYGSSSTFGAWRGTGPFEVRGVVAQEDAADTLRQVLVELERLGREPLSAEELVRAKTAALRQIPLRFATLSSTLDAISELAAYDRPADDYAALPSTIEHVTAADIQRVARSYLSAHQLRLFVVADASAVKKSLDRLPIGPLQVLEIETRGADQTRLAPSPRKD